jgi:hypothetical protein
MSNFLAIATVTATLRRLLQNAINAAEANEPGAVSGAQVSSVRPEASQAGLPDRGINVYLYQVTTNPFLNNDDLPTRRPNGSLANRPQVALDLHYLLSFYGQENLLETDRLLGLAVRTLYAQPVLTQQMVHDTLADPLFKFLAASDLADQVETVKFTRLGLSLEELSKLWSVFFQVPYTISVAYQATVVLIESPEVVQPSLPVRQPLVYVLPFRQPAIEQVLTEAGAGAPILAGSTLIINGRGLSGTGTEVCIGNQTLAPAQVSDTQVRVSLASLASGALLAGVQGLQIVQPAMLGAPPTAHAGFTSNMAAIVLHPQIQKDPGTQQYRIGKANMTEANGLHAGQITVKLTPPLGREQHAVLLLNQMQVAAGAPATYAFNAPPRDPATAPASDESVTFTIQDVVTGTFAVRIQADGAESPLDVTAGGQITGPLLVLP